MAEQTLQVYLPNELWEKVQLAQNAPNSKFKATVFCKQQLIQLFEQGSEPDVGETQQSWVPDQSQAVDFGSQLDKALAHDFRKLGDVEYDLHYEESTTSGMAYLNDVVQPGGGRPVSVWTDVAGRTGILVAWPK